MKIEYVAQGQTFVIDYEIGPLKTPRSIGIACERDLAKRSSGFRESFYDDDNGLYKAPSESVKVVVTEEMIIALREHDEFMSKLSDKQIREMFAS